MGHVSLEKTTSEVAAIGAAIRSHVEAGVFNDLTRADTTAVFKSNGEDQQSAVEELKQHAKLLQERIGTARALVIDAASRSMLGDENQLADRYVHAEDLLIDAIVHRPSEAPALLGPDLQPYKELQGKIEVTSDQLGKTAEASELGAKKKAAEAKHGVFVICGASLLILLAGSFTMVRAISQSRSSLLLRSGPTCWR